MTPTLEVAFFVTSKGSEPVREWLKTLPPADRRTIGEDIKTVQYGWPLGMPLVRKLAPGLWEVRSHLPRGRIVRVIFSAMDSQMVLLHGFMKKSPKTPASDLDLANDRLKEFLNG